MNKLIPKEDGALLKQGSHHGKKIGNDRVQENWFIMKEINDFIKMLVFESFWVSDLSLLHFLFILPDSLFSQSLS